jgi:hypothetical protein
MNQTMRPETRDE